MRLKEQWRDSIGRGLMPDVRRVLPFLLFERKELKCFTAGVRGDAKDTTISWISAVATTRDRQKDAATFFGGLVFSSASLRTSAVNQLRLATNWQYQQGIEYDFSSTRTA
jgi:hypothetical protein